MKKTILMSCLIMAVTFTNIYKAVSQQAISIGPMLHINFGEGPVRPSFGIEVAYWNYKHFPYSVDVGFEFEKSKFRIYSEAQTGIIVTGLSAGPFVEFKKTAPVQLGFQGAFWVNYFIGFDCRFRWQKGKDYIAPGIYAKYPFMVGPDVNEHNGNHSDWDWD